LLQTSVIIYANLVIVYIQNLPILLVLWNQPCCLFYCFRNTSRSKV